VNVLGYIKEKCGIKEGEIDLAEEPTGLLQFLTETPLEYASNILRTRGMYVPVQCLSTCFCIHQKRKKRLNFSTNTRK
jgi:hypothetical protein